MKKASLTGLPGGARPSSVRRICNLRALVEEFGERDIGCAAAALFLSCSLTSARNYVSELLDAGVVASHPVRQGAGCLDRTLYQLTADPQVVHEFLAALARSHGGDGNPAHHGAERIDMPPESDHIHGAWGAAPARRDPLVAALFGAPAS